MKSKNTLIEQRQESRKRAIFLTVRSQNGQLSRNDLCKITQYSITSVSAIIDEWIQEGVMSEMESTENRIGRPPVILAIKPDSIYFAGIECSAWGVNFSIINALEEIIYHDSRILTRPKTQDVIDEINNILARFITSNNDIWAKIPSLTISMPGQLDEENGIGIFYANISDWRNVNVGEYFKTLDKQLFFINNVDGMLLGYRAVNQFPRDTSVLFMLIRNGTGVRLYSKGVLLSSLGLICEFGHTRSHNSNRLCICGRRGCYDAEITNTAVQNKIQEALSANKLTAISTMAGEGISAATVQTLLDLVEINDPDACEIFDNVAVYIAELLEQISFLFRPGAIVVCADLCQQKQRLMKTIAEAFRHPGYIEQHTTPKIDYVLPRDEFTSLGSAITGYNNYFKTSDVY